MIHFPSIIENLNARFNKFPGVGPKTSLRFVFYLLKLGKEELTALAQDIVKLKDAVRVCEICQNLSDNSPCSICADARRDKTVLCVVSESPDLYAIENTQNYRGLYFVLGGKIDPLRQKQSENEIKIQQLAARAKNDPQIKEIILAFDSTIEGESTMLYLIRLLKPLNKKITRLARGLPLGSELEYADQVTLGDALNERQTINQS